MSFDVQAAYQLENLRLWDLPAAKAGDALKMNKIAKTYKRLSTRIKPITKKEMRMQGMIDDIRGREQPESGEGGEAGLPGCEVNIANIPGLSKASLAHVRDNQRVRVCGSMKETHD